MPWIRFWHEGNCPSGFKDQESSYEWLEAEEDDEALKEEADERVPDWRKQAERGYKYGFERVEELPEKVRQNLIKRFERQKVHADRMLGILIPKTSKTRLERV